MINCDLCGEECLKIKDGEKVEKYRCTRCHADFWRLVKPRPANWRPAKIKARAANSVSLPVNFKLKPEVNTRPPKTTKPAKIKTSLGRHTCGYCGINTDYACDVPKCNNVGGKIGICERCQKSGRAIKNSKFIETKRGWIMSRGYRIPDGYQCLNCGWSD